MSFTSWNNFWNDWEEKQIKAGRTRYAKNYHQNINFSSVGSYHNFIFRGAVKNFSKQSVVKMIRNVSANGIKAVIDYTLKNSIDGLAFNEKGEKVSSEQIVKDWSKDFGTNKNSKDAWHLMFSINEPLDNERTLKALRESVEQVMASNFEGYKYSLVIHTHQNNPHAHVVMNKRNLETKKKIHFNSNSELKEFFDELRTNFAFHLSCRGLKYENKHSLQKDLKEEFTKIKSSVNIPLDEYNAKDRLRDYYFKMQERNNADFVATDTRIRVLKNECDELKKSNDELLELYLQYVKKRNKRSYKLARELKEQNKILRAKRKEIFAEIKKIQHIEFNAKRLNDWQMSNYKDESKSVVLLENFVYNFHKLYPKNKGASKADFENLQKVKKAIAELRGRKDDNAKKYLDDSLLLTRMLGNNESLFKLGNKLEVLDKNLYILKISNFEADEALAWEKRLKWNKEFLLDVCEKRFKVVEQKLLNSEKIDKNDFLFKEYFKGVELLDKKADERLVKIKNEKRLIKDVLAECSASRSQTAKKDKDLNKNSSLDFGL